MLRQLPKHGWRVGFLLAGLSMVIPTADAQEIRRIPADGGAQLQLLRVVPISPEVAGTLRTVNPSTVGVTVREGDPLISLNDDVIRREVAHAEEQARQTTEVDFAKKTLELAELELKVRVAANEKKNGTFTPSEMRQTQLEVEKSFAQLRKAEDDRVLYELDAETKKAQLAQYSVVAPFDGLVTQVHRYPGNSVRPGDPVLTLADVSELQAEVKVNFKYRDLLFAGDEVEFRLDTSRQGVVREQPTPVRQEEVSSPFDNDKATAEDDDNPFPDLDDESPPEITPAPGSPAVDAPPSDLVFRGTIQLIDPAVVPDVQVNYVVIKVKVPNLQDQHGRYLLQQAMPVTAVVLAAPR